MIASDGERWWLVVSMITLVINVLAVIYIFYGIAAGRRKMVTYLPGVLLVILGLCLNISRHLSIIPSEFSQYALWFAVIILTIGCILIERQRKRNRNL